MSELPALRSDYVIKGWRRIKGFPLCFALAFICAQDPNEHKHLHSWSTPRDVRVPRAIGVAFWWERAQLSPGTPKSPLTPPPEHPQAKGSTCLGVTLGVA